MQERSVVKFVCLVGGLVCLVGFLVGAAFKEFAGRGGFRNAGGGAAPPPLPPPVAFGNPVAPAPGDAREFDGFFTALGGALARGDAAAVGAVFDAERFTDEADRAGLFDRIPGDRSRNRQTFARTVHQNFGQGLVNNETFRWDRVEVQRVRWAPDRAAAVVVASHLHAEAADVPMRIRWWLTRSPTGWKVYDLEELEFGVRTSALIGLLVTPDVLAEFGSNPGRLQAAIQSLREASTAIAIRENADEAERHLDEVRRLKKLPPVLLALQRLIEARVLLEKLNPDEAVRRLDDADRLHPGIRVSALLRALALALLDRPDEALPLVRAYIDELGGDGHGYAVEGLALERLERTDEAAAAYRRALDAVPDLSDALDGLRRVLPDDAKGELATRLARATRPAVLYDAAHELAQEAGDYRAIEELQIGLWRAVPDDARGLAPALRRLVAEKKYAAAAAAVRRGLDRVPADKKAQVLGAYLYAMSDCDRHGEAYAAVPPAHAAEAFLRLAESLDSDLFDDPDDAELPGWRAATTGRLRALVAAHRKAAPGDPWVGFYAAVALQHDKKYAEAERAFAAAHAAYLKAAPPAPADPDDDRDWRGGQFRSRRVECLRELKQGLRALAEVGPAQDTFEQLANRCHADRDAAALEALTVARFWQSPGEPAVRYWSAVALDLRNEPVKAAETYRAYARAVPVGPREYRRRHAIAEAVRRYLRADRLADARAVAEEFGAAQVSAGLRAALALAGGRPAEAEQILADLAADEEGVREAYYDEDFARLVARPEFADLRTKYPDPRPQKPAPKKD